MTKKAPKPKHPGGRPTKFKPEYCKQLVEFFSLEPYRREIAEQAKEFFANGDVKKESKKFRLIANRLPTLYGFAKKIKVDYTTLWRWAEKGEDEDGTPAKDFPELAEFCKAYKEAKELQKEFLISLGLSGAAPPASFIFVAKNVTDMRDKQEVEVTRPDPEKDRNDYA